MPVEGTHGEVARVTGLLPTMVGHARKAAKMTRSPRENKKVLARTMVVATDVPLTTANPIFKRTSSSIVFISRTMKVDSSTTNFVTSMSGKSAVIGERGEPSSLL